MLIFVGALFVSIASYAIWFHTSCGISVEVSDDQFKDTQEVKDYMLWLEKTFCVGDPSQPPVEH